VCAWILADPENVIIVHCNSGKGRTGTAICAALLFCGYLDNVDDSLRFYGHQRFTCGKGVSQPCQLRYLYYFEAFYKGHVKSPAIKRLRGIQFDKVPNISGGGCVPFFDVYQCDGLHVDKIFSYPAAKHYKVQDGGVIFLLTEQQRQGWTLKGDIKILFRHAGFSNETFCRLMFNTAFIQNGNYIKAGKMELSPEDIRKDKGKILPNDFKVYVFFDDFCSQCSSLNTAMKDLCDKCKNELGSNIIREWTEVHKIIDRHSFPEEEEAKKLLPNTDPELL